MELAATIISITLALGLFFVGFLFVANEEKAFAATEHEPVALPKVMGGRYFGLGAIILGLLWLGNHAALAIAFAVGAFLGFFDGVVTYRVGGLARGQVIVGVAALILSILFAILSPEMVS